VPVERVILHAKFCERDQGRREGVQELDSASEVTERIGVFRDAVYANKDAPGAVLCRTAEQLQAHVDYHRRVREQGGKFTWLTNVLDITTLALDVRREGADWHCEVAKAESGRLESESLLDAVREALTGLNTAKLQNAGGRLIPEKVRAEVASRLDGWFREKKRIGCTCEVSLTLQCPDHQTTLDIQQSPIKVEVK
jgi:hypothetical protein